MRGSALPAPGTCAAEAGCITIRIYTVRYEWDEEKNRRNQRKHGGISFELAALAFEDEHCLIGPDRVDKLGSSGGTPSGRFASNRTVLPCCW